MLPHKAKEFIKPTAEKLGKNEDLVRDIVSFYWQTVRHTLSNPENIAVTVANFGTFNIKPWKLDPFIKKYEGIAEHTKLDTFTKFASVKQMEKKKLIVDKLKVKFAEAALKKQSIKDKRNGKGTITSLEK